MLKTPALLTTLFALTLCSNLACDAPRGGTLDELMADAVAKGFAGNIYITKNDARIWNESYGDAVEGEVPFTSNTVSSIGSLTKQFTAAAILAAQEEGILSVNDRVGAHIEGVSEEIGNLSLHQLLSHTSGLPSDGGFDEDLISREAWLEDLNEKGLDAPTGDFQYSNQGYTLLAIALENATATSYENYLRQRFFEPLGLENTGYDGVDWSAQTLAQGYVESESYGEPLGATLGDNHWNVVGNGEMLSNVIELTTWMKALKEGDVLSEASLDALWGEQAPTGFNEYYGYGWGVSGDLGKRVIGHNGGNGAFFCHVAWFEESDLSVVILANREPSWIGNFIWDVADRALRLE